VPDPPTDPVLREMFETNRARGGQIINLHLTLGNAPKLAKASQAMAHALRYDGVTPRIIRELTIMRTAQIVGSDYELNQHHGMALASGLSEAQVAAIATWQGSKLFDEKQRAVLGYVEEVAHGGEVSDATFAAVQKFFNPAEIVELSLTIGSYYGTGLVTKALRIKVESDGRRAAP
jgi:alkylhydroperoxidase family enzyme